MTILPRISPPQEKSDDGLKKKRKLLEKKFWSDLKSILNVLEFRYYFFLKKKKWSVNNKGENFDFKICFAFYIV